MHARVRNSRSSCFSSTTDQKSEDGATRAKGKGEEKSSCELLVARRIFTTKEEGAWKSRKLKTETDTETDGGNGNTQAIIT